MQLFRRLLTCSIVLSFGGSPVFAQGSTQAAKEAARALASDLTSGEGYVWLYRPNTVILVNRASQSVVKDESVEPLRGLYNLRPDFLKSSKMKDLRVTALEGEAWVSFSLALELTASKQERELRVTALLEESDITETDAWYVLVAHVSDGVKDATTHARARAGTLPALAPLAEADSVTEGMTEIVAALRAGRIVDYVSDRADMVVVGSAPGEKRIGGKKTKKAWKTWWSTVTVDGPVLAEGGPNSVGWVMANLKAKKRKGGVEYVIPFRLFLLCNPEPGGMRVVQAHLSVAPE